MDRRARRECLAVTVTALANVFAEWIFGTQATFIGIALVAWLVYLGSCVRQDRGILATWGFRRQGLGSTLAATSLLVALAILAMAWIGAKRGHLSLNVHMVPLALLYPIWGWLQHLLMLGIFLRNLVASRGALSKPSCAIPLIAVLFALVHAPDIELMFATFLLALLMAPIYLLWRNLWPIGLYHGWLGVVMYFWVLGEDPWQTIFG